MLLANDDAWDDPAWERLSDECWALVSVRTKQGRDGTLFPASDATRAEMANCGRADWQVREHWERVLAEIEGEKERASAA